MSDLSLLWTILSYVGWLLGGVAGAAWWFKGQLTSAEMAGLREQNEALREQKEVHTSWRQLAEAQKEQLAKELAEAQATTATMQQQIAQGAEKEVLANTAASSSRAIEHANNLLKSFVFARSPSTRLVDLIDEGAPELTKKSND